MRANPFLSFKTVSGYRGVQRPAGKSVEQQNACAGKLCVIRYSRDFKNVEVYRLILRCTTAAGKEITVYLNIYGTKLTGSNLYVVVSSEAAQTTYKGEQVTPEVTVYYGDAQTVKAAKKDKVTDETKLTSSGLAKLAEKKDAA